MNHIYAYETIIGSILGITIFLIIVSSIIEKFFPKNKISKLLENAADWIADNIKI